MRISISYLMLMLKAQQHLIPTKRKSMKYVSRYQIKIVSQDCSLYAISASYTNYRWGSPAFLQNTLEKTYIKSYKTHSLFDTYLWCTTKDGQKHLIGQLLSRLFNSACHINSFLETVVICYPVREPWCSRSLDDYDSISDVVVLRVFKSNSFSLYQFTHINRPLLNVLTH